MNRSTPSRVRPLPTSDAYDRSVSCSRGCNPNDPLEGVVDGDLLPVPNGTVSHPLAAACVQVGFCRSPDAFGPGAFDLLFRR